MASCGLHANTKPPSNDIEPLTFRNYVHAFDWCNSILQSIVGIAQLTLDNDLLEAVWHMPVDLFDFFMIRRPWTVWLSSNRIALEAVLAVGDRQCGSDLQDWLLDADFALRRAKRGGRDQVNALSEEACGCAAPQILTE